MRDILVKRIIIDKKKKKEVSYLQNISQKTVKQEYDLINQTIINTQNIVEKYSLEPSNFTIISIQGNDNASNMDNQSGDIEVHFTLKNNKEKIGTISFNNNGILTTPTITQNNKTYTVSQNGTNVYITENQLTSN